MMLHLIVAAVAYVVCPEQRLWEVGIPDAVGPVNKKKRRKKKGKNVITFHAFTLIKRFEQ